MDKTDLRHLGGLALFVIFLFVAFVGIGPFDEEKYCQDTTTIEVPAKSMPLNEYERFVEVKSSCVSIESALTARGQAPPDMVVEPLGGSVAVTKGEPLIVLVEAAPKDFWLHCGDFTGRRASNFPSFADRERCDPTIDTRCMSDGRLTLCPEIGPGKQRCLNAKGHVSLRCGPHSEVCLRTTGRFKACWD